MMGYTNHLRIFLALEPCDLRKSFNGLAALATDYLQGDETPLRLLAPGTGKTATSYFWVFNDPTGSISYHLE